MTKSSTFAFARRGASGVVSIRALQGLNARQTNSYLLANIRDAISIELQPGADLLVFVNSRLLHESSAGIIPSCVGTRPFRKAKAMTQVGA